MGAQIKIILIIVAILAVLGAAGVGLHYGSQGIDETDTARSDGEKLAAVPPAEDESAGKAEAPAGKAIPPVLDIVRVEPSGDLVAAGRAASNALVTLYLGDEELDKAEANSIGEWAMVLSEPLAPGSYDLSLRATGRNGKGDAVEGDRVTVVIEGDGKTPLVAVTRPGEPTEVVQQPEEETVVAAADTAPEASSEASPAASSDASSSAPVSSTPSAEVSGQSAESQSDAASRSDTDSNETVASAQDQSGSDQSGAGASETDQSAAAPSQTQSSESAPAASADEPAGTQQAATVPGAAQSTSEQGAAESTGADQASETTVAAASTEPSASQPQAGAPQESGEQASQEPAEQPAQEPAQEPTGQPTGKVTIETVEVEDPGRLMLSGEAEPGDAIRLYLNNEQLADVKTGANGRWTLSSERPMPPGRYELRADVVEETGKVKARAEVKFDRIQMVAADDAAPSPDAAESAQASGSGEATVETSAEGSGGPGATVTIVSHAGGSGTASVGSAVGEGAGTSVVVIARGDNLWRIARKIYGKGVRHSTIFEANKNQIRNPDLIYPGQVFTIPVLEGENG